MISEECKSYFQEVIRHKPPESKPSLGLEYENAIIISDPKAPNGYRPLPTQGPHGVLHVLEQLQEQGKDHGVVWTPILDNNHWIGLSEPSGTTITLEPGGQVELSGAPQEKIAAVYNELKKHFIALETVVKEIGGESMFMGVNPLFSRDEIPLINKTRYHIMYPYMATVGEHGQLMMKLTSSAQVSVDYFSMEDLTYKSVFLNRLAPFLTAIFANSPFYLGQYTGYHSFRSRIWQDTDGPRCRIPQSFFEDSFRIEDYIHWAQQASPYFLMRDGLMKPFTHQTFKQLMEKAPSEVAPVTMADWSSHLGMLFPPVRIKQILEIRTMDILPPHEVIAIPALIKGLLYSPKAFEKARDLLMALPAKAFMDYEKAAAKEGLHAHLHGAHFGKLSQQLFEIAFEGLGLEEEGWLIPYFEKYTKHQQSPADQSIEKFLKQAKSNIKTWMIDHQDQQEWQSLL